MKKKLSALCIIFSVLVMTYIMMLLGVITYFNSPNKYHSSDKRFIIESGMTLREVVNKLHSEGIVKRPAAFLYMSQIIKGVDPKVRYGEYFFEKNLSYYKILHKMIRGNVFFRKVTIAEGLSTDSAIKIIDRAPGLIGQIPTDIEEGSLLPETYFYSYNDTKASMVNRMREAMRKNLDELWSNRDPNTPVKTKEEAIKLASIVERETGVPSERPKVASVFVNRLNKRMKLQSDPTIIYSFTKGNKDLERPIKVSDRKNKSPYNTYHIYGLPPSPICNPGIDAIKAVLNPIQTNYLYFVADGYGEHIFTTNFKDHNKYVDQYRDVMKQKQLEEQNDEIIDKESNPGSNESKTPILDDTMIENDEKKPTQQIN
ncbi:MAG: endolytic transglycosylase MltG [Rickettsiales bacterium]|nr:endolytic transglycosylase MltG [Rickettsiales bacterium]